MYRAEISLSVLKHIGMWRPKHFSQRILAMYDVFSFLMVLFTYIFTFSTLMYLFRGNPNIEEFTDSCFYVLGLLAASVKIANIFFKRDEIIQLTNMLLDKRCSPRDFFEFCVQEKFDRISRFLSKYCIVILIYMQI